MKARRCLVGLTAAALTLLGAGPAVAAESVANPAEFCKESGNAEGYLASTGGCASSVASIGIDALLAGAFPSRAAATANCKQIASSVGGFPYSFYGRVDDDRYLATNINSCVGILYALHTGQLQPGPA